MSKSVSWHLSNGVDIVELARVKKLMMNPRFFHRLFTPAEVLYFKRRQYRVDVVAGRLAAKEAVAKALNTGIRNFKWKDIEVLPDGYGSPVVTLYHGASEAALSLSHQQDYNVSLSISHNREMAIAFCSIVYGGEF